MVTRPVGRSTAPHRRLRPPFPVTSPCSQAAAAWWLLVAGCVHLILRARCNVRQINILYTSKRHLAGAPSGSRGCIYLLAAGAAARRAKGSQQHSALWSATCRACWDRPPRLYFVAPCSSVLLEAVSAWCERARSAGTCRSGKDRGRAWQIAIRLSHSMRNVPFAWIPRAVQ